MSQVLGIVTDYVISHGHWGKTHPLTFQKDSDVMSRWPEIKIQKTKGLEMQRDKATRLDCVKKYCIELI